jgi:hypothetical protein
MHSAIDQNGGTQAGAGIGSQTITWINVTTAHTIADLVDLEGTAVLNYNVEGPASDLSSTAVAVYVLSSGSNETDSTGDSISVLTSGNARSGVVDLDDGTYHITNNDVMDLDMRGVWCCCFNKY